MAKDRKGKSIDNEEKGNMSINEEKGDDEGRGKGSEPETKVIYSNPMTFYNEVQSINLHRQS